MKADAVRLLINKTKAHFFQNSANESDNRKATWYLGKIRKLNGEMIFV